MGMIALIASAQAQNLTGKVIDEKNIPLAYANVILQTVDSVYLAGTTNDVVGNFKLAKHENAKLKYNLAVDKYKYDIHIGL